MPSRYKVAFGLTGLALGVMEGSTIRDSTLIDGPKDLSEQVPGTYEADAGVTWQDGDDIIYYYNGTIVASTTHRTYPHWRQNTA
jgi:hypothetical protein